ncbi:MAG TPA: phage tail protein [Acidimicrobiales bacterium]|jgi:phage tail-like protein|nr:phage tail protein [Acidimicrobiales bacterium]
MRGEIPDLASPSPVVAQMPAIYQDDAFTCRYTSAFDAVLAPIITTLDCIDAYTDPNLTPVDFLDWLAGWVGLSIDEDWPLERQRTFVSQAVRVYRLRGTAAGLRAEVEIYSQGSVEVVESGACIWSSTPNVEMPGSPTPSVEIRVRTTDPTRINLAGLEAIVSAAKPAHVVHRIDVVRAE